MKLVIAEKPMLARDIARAICGKEVSETARLPISGKPMVVTINHDPMNLRDALEEQQQRILDRILERCYPIA